MDTLYIYLDESGTFEFGNSVSLIAGLAYLAPKNEDPSVHQAAIGACLKEAAAGWNIIYPTGLHSTENEQLKNTIYTQFPAVTRALFSSKRYMPFVSVCLNNEIEKSQKDADMHLEGMYRHMLTQLMTYIVQSSSQISSFHFYIPTRTVAVAAGQESYYRDLGIELKTVKDTRSNHVEINAQGTHFSTQDDLRHLTNAQIRLHVHKINYDIGAPDYQHGYRMADWLNCYCGKLCRKLTGPITVSSTINLKQISDHLGSFFSAGAQVISYGKYYDRYIHAIQSAASPNPTDYLLTLHEYQRFEHLSPYAERLLRFNPFADEACIRAVDHALHINYYIRARYHEVQPLYALLLDLAQSAGHKGSAALASVQSKLMCCWQHLGEADKAHALFNTCWQQNISYMLRLDILNKYVQTLLDVLEFQKAKELITEAVTVYDMNRENLSLWSKVQGQKDPELETVLCKCRSSRGQISGFLEEGDGLQYFEQALQGFKELGQTGNYRITVGHLLHYAISQFDFDTFGAYAADYFGSSQHDYTQFSTWADWYGSLLVRCEQELSLPNPDTSGRFALLIYFKALYTYLTECMDGGKLWSDDLHTLLFCDDSLFALSDRLDAPSHPFELIYKYIALLARCCAANSIATDCAARLKAIRDSSSSTIRLISQIGMGQLAYTLNQRAQLPLLRTELSGLLATLNNQWSRVRSNESIQESSITALLDRFKLEGDQPEVYSSLLTYEYA